MPSIEVTTPETPTTPRTPRRTQDQIAMSLELKNRLSQKAKGSEEPSTPVQEVKEELKQDVTKSPLLESKQVPVLPKSPIVNKDVKVEAPKPAKEEPKFTPKPKPTPSSDSESEDIEQSSQSESEKEKFSTKEYKTKPPIILAPKLPDTPKKPHSSPKRYNY